MAGAEAKGGTWPWGREHVVPRAVSGRFEWWAGNGRPVGVEQPSGSYLWPLTARVLELGDSVYRGGPEPFPGPLPSGRLGSPLQFSE